MSTSTEEIGYLAKLVEIVYPLGFKNHFKVLLKNAIPLVLTNLSESMFAIVSIIFCGHIGKDELDAASLSNTLINVCGLAVVIGLTSAAETLFPQLYGSENKKNVGIVLQKGIIISIVASFPSIGLLINSKNFMILLKQNENVAMLADWYILIYSPSILFYALSNILNRFIQSQDIVIPVVIINAVANVLNVILHAILIHGFKLGIIGSAIAVLASNIFLTVVTFLYIYISKVYVTTWPGWSWKCLEDWKTYLKLGIPGIFILGMEWFIFEIGAFMAGTLGTVELGAMSIVLQILSFCFMIPNGIGIAGNILIGQLLGMNEPNAAKNAYRVVLTICVICSAITVLIIVSTAEILPWAFTHDSDVRNMASKLLLIIAILHIFDAEQGTFGGILKAAGAQLYGSIMSLIGFYLIGLPIGAYFMLKTSLRVYGFWIGMTIGSICLVAMQIAFTMKIDWNEKAKLANEFANSTKMEILFKTQANEQLNNEIRIEIQKTFAIQTDPIFKEDTSKSKENYKKLLILRIISVIVVILVSSIGIFTRNLVPFNDIFTQTFTNLTDNINNSTINLNLNYF